MNSVENLTEQLYCSVDLEFTGFDPDRDQILEIGFAFFRMTEQGAEVIEKWGQVFRPSIEVHPKILGLTGISQEELDNAPEFAEYREFLQEKLGNAIIVGHNPVMDVKFLESYGIKLSGQVIDTLELVQFILPTHHSYNLENLVHYFGISHEDNQHAHRALADAISTIRVLEDLLMIYQSFPAKLKKELQAVMDRGEFLWQQLFGVRLKTKAMQANDSLKPAQAVKHFPFLLTDKLVSVDTAPNDHEARVALGLQTAESETVLAVPNSNTVMRLWRDGLVHGLFSANDTFSKASFNKFLEQAQSPEELRFCLKVLVWLRTNWQNEAILDLNISFFGGQFRGAITGGRSRKPKHKILCVDYESLADIQSSAEDLVICDIQGFEQFVSSGLGDRLSWMGVLYQLKNIYNPENETGEASLEEKVLTALAAADLFFSLSYMLLSKTFSGKEYVTIAELAGNHEYIHNRLLQASEHLREKILVLAKAAPKKLSLNAGLPALADKLGKIFQLSDNRVKWVYIDEQNLAFYDRPLDIAEEGKKLLDKYQTVRFTDTVTNQRLLSYYTDRLGFHAETSEFTENLRINKLALSFHNQELDDAALYQASSNVALPLVVVFAAPAEVKNFYNQYYKEIKQTAALFAQGYSGGGNKMFRNFSINENSVLLATADFIAKQNYKISAKSVIFTELPPVDSTHPYTAALLSAWKNRFPNLERLLSYAKIAAVLKKLKLRTSVGVIVYKSDDKSDFVDN